MIVHILPQAGTIRVTQLGVMTEEGYDYIRLYEYISVTLHYISVTPLIQCLDSCLQQSIKRDRPIWQQVVSTATLC